MEKKPDVKGRGISLRKRKTTNTKPVIGPPRQIAMPPMPGAKLPTTAETPRIANRDRQKVADMVKRRMSTRYAPGEAGEVPAMPVMPDLSQIPGSLARKAQAAAKGQDLDVDLDAFREPGFDAEQYVQKILANATDQEIKEFLERLRDSRRRTSSDLQKNVFVNRTQFILISKEIDKLKSEMRTLRGLLNDLHNTTSSLKLEPEIPGSAALNAPSMDMYLSNSKARKAANRNSIADLTALHMTHLQTLWKQVEGAQKFLPAVPGRHILVESRDWLELNAATWKPRRQVHMVLLNDHLLLAAKKRKRVDPNNPHASQRKDGGGPMVKLVAERCWPLVEIEMVDLSPDSKSGRGNRGEAMSNAINIRVGKESFVFRNEDKDLKVKLLIAFKKTADELRKALRAESEDKHRIRDSLTYLTARDPALLSQGELLKTLSATMSKDQPSILFHFDGQPRNLRWVENQMDDLDERIAHRRFEDSVALLEKLRNLAISLKNNLLAADLVTIKLDERAARLASLITTELVDNVSRKSLVQKTVLWLCRLNYEDRAREVLLEAKSGMIKKRTRQVRFEGDIPLYISQIALVQFTLIRNTVEIYNSCFDHKLASALVKWAKEHVASFIELYQRQLEGVEKGDQVRKNCEDIVMMHSAMLVDVGLDFFRNGEILEQGMDNGPIGGELKKSVGLGI
ncbi:Cullin repeat-like-containing domain protein [Kalaharituber pfeilii]|nr:Cullin repeat-like-containing domain protein [Kalaharituber pfeilii]